MPIAELSPLDEERFGIRVAKASVADAREAASAIAEARMLGATMIIARCDSRTLSAAHALEDQGGRIMDILVYFARDLAKHTLPHDESSLVIRPLETRDVDSVVRIARESFQGYPGHYHVDPRIDPDCADEVYVSWTQRLCESQAGDDVLIAEAEGSVLGYMTFRMNSSDEGEAVLGGVARAAQSRGIYRALLVRGMNWCLAHGASRMVVSTQISNQAVQKVWSRLQFEPYKSYLTFHCWLNGDGPDGSNPKKRLDDPIQ